MARIEIEVEPELARFNKGHLRRLLAMAGPYRRQMLFALGFILVSAACQLSVPWLIQRGIDHHIVPPEGGDFAGLVRVVAALVGVIALYAYSHYRRTYLMSLVGQRVLYELRQRVFAHMQRLSFKFYESQPSGKIIARLTSDVRHLQEFLTNGLIMMAADTFAVVGIIAVMLYMHTQLALISFIVLPIVVVVVALLRVKIRRAHVRERETMANIYANVQESIAGVGLVQAYARQRLNEEHFDTVNSRNLGAALHAARLSGSLNPVVEVTSALAVSLILWYGALTLTGEAAGQALTVGILVAFIAYLQQLYDPIRDLSNVYNVMQSAMASADRIFEVLETEPEVTDKPGAYDLPALRGDVRLEEVTFGYKPDIPVLRDVNLDIPAGETVALVGPTGAGKTSLINLIARFYDPTEGAVRIDGHDLRDVTLRSLRSQIAIVIQDPFLFSGTIRDNIRYGRPDATDEEVVAAAKPVHAHDFIMRLPDGYDTEVNERGGKLSNGQRQLLSFARALLMDPGILILDEATSNVDATTEVYIQEAMNRLLAGRTAFVVAHRLSTIRNADRIIVVDDGRIQQMGDHQQLMAQPGLYRQLNEVHLKYTADA